MGWDCAWTTGVAQRSTVSKNENTTARFMNPPVRDGDVGRLRRSLKTYVS
jgi:hypothetical protein